MARDEVSIVIRARDLATRVFKRVSKSIELNTQNIKRMVRGLGLLAAAAAGAVAAMAKMISRGSELLNVQKAFNNIAGGEGVAALNKLRVATQGLITDYELMKNANQAISLGAVKTIDGFKEMAELAQGLGRAFGITATEALEKFTVGLARMSKLRLDDLGIVINVEKANEAYAKSLNKSAAALTENERAFAFRNAAMGEARRLVEGLGTAEGNAADSVGRLTTALKNALDALSVLIAQAPGVTAFFEKFAEGAANMATVFAGTGEQIRRSFEILGVIAWNGFAIGLSTGLQGLLNLIEKLGFGGIFSSIADKLESSMIEAVDNIKVALRELAALAETVAPEMPLGAGALGGGGGGGAVGLSGILVGGRAGVSPSNIGIGAPGGQQSVAAGLVSQRLNRRNAALVDLYNKRLEEQGTVMDAAADSSRFMATTVINAFSQMAAAAVAGSQNMVSSIVGGLTSIGAAAATVAFGPTAGAGVAAGGGFLQGLFNRGPAPVRVDSYSSSALNSLRDLEVKEFNLTTIIRQDGAGIWQTQQKLLELERQDGSIRIVPVGGVVIGGSNG